MSKSRYSKNKSYGAMVGLNSYNRNMSKQVQLVPQENRQMRQVAMMALEQMHDGLPVLFEDNTEGDRQWWIRK